MEHEGGQGPRQGDVVVDVRGGVASPVRRHPTADAGGALAPTGPWGVRPSDDVPSRTAAYHSAGQWENSDHCHLESQTKRKCALPGSPSTCPPYRFRQPPTRSYAPNPRPGVVAQPDAKTPVRVMFSVTCNPDQGWCICRWVKGVWVGLAKDR